MFLQSTKGSLENREVSFLAIIEVFLAVAITWILAIYFNTNVHMIVSIFFAPFFLLRSDKSINMGLSLFESGVRSKRKDTVLYRLLFEIVLVLNIVSITYILFQHFLNINDISFVLFFLLFCSGIGVGMGVALFGVMDNQRMGILSIFPVLITSIYLGGFNVFIIMISFILFGVIILILFKKYAQITLGIIAGTFLGIGVAVGILFMTFIYKIVAVLSNFSYGYKNIIQNWKYNNFILNIKHPAEIMFGIEKYKGLDEFKLSKYFDGLKESDNMIQSFSVAAIYLILYPFSLITRFSIKATFWFYIPLLILVKTPRNINDNIEIKDFLSKLHRYSYVKFFFWIAAISLGIFFIANLKPNYLEEWNSPFSVYMSVIYFDFSSIEIWKLLQILMAFLTVILYFWSDVVWKKEENRGMNFINKKYIQYMFFVNNLRNLVSFFYFLFLLIYIGYKLEVLNNTYMPHILPYILDITQYKLF